MPFPALRHQVSVLRRQHKGRLRLFSTDRLLWVCSRSTRIVQSLAPVGSCPGEVLRRLGESNRSPHANEHRLACPNSAIGLAFPNTKGNVDHRNSIVVRGLHPAQVAAGVIDQHGRAKYKGLHSLRHFYASWCINRRADGGLELPLKVVQARLGHAGIQMTADVYGHLFPRGDDGAVLAAAEKAFL